MRALTLASVLLVASVRQASVEPRVVVVDAVPAIVRTIGVKEGYFKDRTAPRRLKNPGSLVYAGQPKARKTRRIDAMAKFEREEDGWEALERDVRAKLGRGTCLTRGWTYLTCLGSLK